MDVDAQFRAKVWRWIIAAAIVFYTTCGYLAFHWHV